MASFIVTYSVLVQEEDMLNFLNSEHDEERVKNTLESLRNKQQVSEEDIEFAKNSICDTADYYLTCGGVTPIIHQSDDIPELVD